MRVCFVNSEIFSSFTGYSRLNRIVGRELIRRGVEVFVLVPQIDDKRRIEQLDGMTVLSFPNLSPKMLFSNGFFRLPQADIYEIWDPYFVFSYLVTRATPSSKHVVVFADPHDTTDYKTIMAGDPSFQEARKRSNLRIPYVVLYLYLKFLRPYLAGRVIKRADAYFYEARYLVSKVSNMHRLYAKPVFLPHATEIPEWEPAKSSEPTVCFLAHWGVKKHPERFMELAQRFPDVRFIQMGGTNDPSRSKMVKDIGSGIANLEIVGIVDEEQKAAILEKSWILVNTSIHEGLPQAFVEACAYRCAILSSVNPDDYASNFGYYVDDEDFEAGLSYLLEGDRWREKGEAGFQYVKENNELDKVIDRRIEVYESLLGKQ